MYDCGSLTVISETTGRRISIVSYRNILEMDNFFVQPTEGSDVVHKSQGLQAMQFCRNDLKSIIHRARRDTVCVFRRVMLTSCMQAVIRNITCIPKSCEPDQLTPPELNLLPYDTSAYIDAVLYCIERSVSDTGYLTGDAIVRGAVPTRKDDG